MKTWHKIVIGAGIFLVFSCIAASVLIGIGSYKTYKAARGFTEGFTNPAVKLAKAKEICDFTMPSGYDVILGMDFMGMKMAMINHMTSQQIIVLLQLPKDSQIPNSEFKKELTGSKEELMKKLNKGSGNSKITKIKESGTFTLNGHEVPYCKAEFENNGKSFDGIIANYECKNSGKNFIIMAMADKGTYNDDITITFLKSLKCH
ncbi:MAG TPA: hypothetical protein PL110_17195 [Candidatus Eremiobacteraeota bacterium]|nr:MAG: hypothetical protein BWY64_03925 [bacterium ADurb.Bin363]HPZ09837.1 hypothetical protein [Candidatus Eremiobacteraeota bacterium]